MAAAAPSGWHRPTAAAAREAVVSSVILALASLATYWAATGILAHVYSVSKADDSLGGLWAVIAAIFVFRSGYELSASAALSRMAATTVSFVLCLVYLLIFPPSVGAMALLIALGAVAVTLLGRPGDAVTTGITTAVVMLVATLNPHDAWEQPILRFFDTLIGVVVGLAAVWVATRLRRPGEPPRRPKAP